MSSLRILVTLMAFSGFWIIVTGFEDLGSFWRQGNLLLSSRIRKNQVIRGHGPSKYSWVTWIL